MSALENIIPERSLIKRKRSNFTKSLDLGGPASLDEDRENRIGDHEFSKSVHVLTDNNENLKSSRSRTTDLDNKRTVKKSFKQYIFWLKGSKPANQQNVLKIEHKENLPRLSTACDYTKGQDVIGGNQILTEDGHCACSNYHYHTFQSRTFCMPPESVDNSANLFSSKFEFVEANQRHLNVCNTFWRPSLSLNQQNYANRQMCSGLLVEFEALWPEEHSLRSLLTDGIQNTALRDAISELALLSVVCGPVHLLESLVNLSLVRLDCHLEDGQGLLHYACLMQRPQLVSYLTKSRVLPELPDRRGYSADEVCFCPQIWRQLPSKYHINTTACPSGETLIDPSFHDKSVLFRMAQMTGNVYEIQMNLQTLNFNVNTECNAEGDFLIHVAVRGGLCQLPLIITLVRLQHADIELCNSKGMTPLMIAALSGNSILCDVLICVLGADPNKVNVENGRSALHYAAQNNQEDVVSSLIKRGADINNEDYSGYLPDDLPTMNKYYTSSDCQGIIRLHRKQRQENLSDIVVHEKIFKDDLVESDLCSVNEEGYTLVMLAAKHNRGDNLRELLDCSVKSVDAQYSPKLNGNNINETGMTALAMAAQAGHKDIVRILLLRGSNPGISDINDYLPLHHAVIGKDEDVVDVMLNFFPATYKGLKKAQDLGASPSLQNKLHKASQRRQEEIVATGLLEYAIEGKADQLYCLIEDGDNVNSKSGFGSWPLYLAVQNGYLDVIKLLCQKGADLRKRHLQTGNTVLHLSASLGCLDVLDFLLNFCKPHFGVDVGRSAGNSKQCLNINAINGDHKTALQLAAEKGYLRVVKCLINHGATTALLDAHGNLFSVVEYDGVCNEILSNRQRHTDIIMNLLQKYSKQNFEELQKVWVPGFDHNLRNHHGDTPLMVACEVGSMDVVLFLLQSAVYPQSFVDDDDYLETFSDKDSGVLDSDSIRIARQEDEGYIVDIPEESVHRNENPDASRLDTLLQDIEKPVGLSIYHDGLISHVCAVSSADHSTALHRCLLKGDNYKIVALILKIDDSCINIQNSLGLTPLHLACQLNRKKCVEKLVNCPEVDLNILTLNGSLPEELTGNKAIIRIVQNGRRGNPVRASERSRSSSITNVSMGSVHLTSPAPSTINLEKVQSRFQALKQNLHKPSE